MSNPIKMYHWTHMDNLTSIAKLGLDPQFSQSGIAAVYACRGYAVDQLADHVRRRHDWANADLVLLQISVGDTVWVRTGVGTILKCLTVVPPSNILVVGGSNVGTPIRDFVKLLDPASPDPPQ